MRTSDSANRRHSMLALTLAGCALALAGCGSSSSQPNASTTRYGPASSPVALSRCMRANGVSGFPDPVSFSGGEGLPLMVQSGDSLVAEGRTFAGPAVRTAERACRAYLPPGGGPPASVRAQQLRRELVLARCMRAHGVPDFPDPCTSGDQAGPSVSINTQAPAFRTAAGVCGAGDNGSFEIGS